MTELPGIADYALVDADFNQLDLLMRGIVSLGADVAWVADRTGSVLAIADREAVVTRGTTLAPIVESKVLRKTMTEVEVAIVTARPLLDLGKLAMALLAVDEVFIPHRRYALESRCAPRRWRL